MIDRANKRSNQSKSNIPCFLYGWGDDLFKPTQIQKNVISIAAGEKHIVFVTSIGQCFGLGSNRFGQLGLENITNCTCPVQVFPEVGKFNTIECGAEFTFVLTNKNQVYATGMNIKGQLGLGNFDDITKLKLVPSLLPHGEKNPKSANKQIMKKMKLPIYNTLQKFEVQIKYEDQDLQLHQPLLDSQQVIEYIACGALHTIVLSSKGRVFGCGFQSTHNNTDDYLQRSLFKLITFQKPIKLIAAGLSGSAALAIDGSIQVWGKFGKLSFNIPTLLKSPKYTTREDIFVQAKVGDGFLLLLDKAGDVYTMGSNIYGQLGNHESFHQKPTRVIMTPVCKNIYAGRNFCLALSQDNKLLGWGSNQNGQLMQGNRTVSLVKGSTDLGFQMKPGEKIVASSYNVFCLKKQSLEQDLQQIEQKQQQETISMKQYVKLQNQLQLLKNLNLALIEKTSKPILIEQSSQTTSKFEVQGVSKHRTFSTNLQITWSELQIEKMISEGGYGIIYRAKWRQSIVAVKKFKIENGDVGLRDFLSQCHAMEAVRHPNIVMFLGVCTKPPHYSIILQYCSNGSLWSILQDPDIKLPWQERRRIAIEIARGVLYLHLCQPPIIHRDLKSLNILLDEHFTVKIADFGWTKALSQYMSCKIGTYQWMAPEVVGTNTYSQKADVFSYAIILWQIASRQPPYKNIKGQQVSNQVLNNNLRPTIPKNTPQQFAKLMKQCWDPSPNKRPNFKQIIKQLQAMKLPSN